MIRFILGFCTVVAGVGAAEGTVPLGSAILITTVGTMIMLWAISGMVRNGDME
jgi:hypothetical protein